MRTDNLGFRNRQMAGGKRPNVRTVAFVLAMCLMLGISARSLGEERSEPLYDIDIPALNAAEALNRLAQQTGAIMLFPYDLAKSRHANAVVGRYTLLDALGRLLEGTGLTGGLSDKRVISISPVEDAERTTKEEAMTSRKVSIGQKIAGLVVSAFAALGASAQDNREDTGRDNEDIEEIIVTGTNIRGIAPESSPTRVFYREDILDSGASTVQEFISRLPQNFGGGSNPGAGFALPNDADSGFNAPSRGGTLGSSVNLRGLGSGSTLVLLNGHRVAPSSAIGDFVDISMIPASALERVEVLTDGASSIYGGDAVAGVVNFILRDDYDGIETTLGYGSVTEGDLTQYRASLTGGRSWSTGNALLVYDFHKRGDLSAADRAISEGAMLPHDLLPSQERNSVLASASQELTANLEMYADLLYSQRESEMETTDSAGQLQNSRLSSTSLNLFTGASWRISETWFMDLSGGYSDMQSDTDQSGALIRVYDTNSDVWTADAKASGTVLTVPGGDLKLAVGGQYRKEKFVNVDVDRDLVARDAERDVYAVFGEALVPIVGLGNAVPGIERLEVNISGRFEDYSDFGSTANPKIGVLWSPFEGLRLRSSYSRSFSPPPLGRIGATDLAASAVRTSQLNGIFGLTPGDPSIADVVVITVFGTDKNLDAETSRAFTAGLELDRSWGQHDFSLRGTFFDIEFEQRLGSTPIPDNRVVFDAPNIAFNSPELFPDGTVIFSPSQSEIRNLVDSLDLLNVAPDADPSEAEIINIAAVVRNLGRTVVTGFDFGASYAFDANAGTVSLGLEGTFLQDFEQQAATTTPMVDRINTLYNPVDLKLRGHAGFVGEAIAANVFLNYVDDYRVDDSAGAMPINSWTTVDFSLSYKIDRLFESAVSDGTVLRLSAINVLDEEPPATPSAPVFGIFGFDPANASALGRFVSVEFTKIF